MSAEFPKNLHTTTSPEEGGERKYDLSFEKASHTPGTELYTFKNVAVMIDTRGTNYQKLPEILFGTFEGAPSGGNIIDKPLVRREGVDMYYIFACLKKTAEVSGLHEFWFHPSGEDGPKREESRLRLFKRYLDFTPESSGYGYIVKI